MALGTPVAGGIAYSAQNGTLVSPAYPGIIAPGDVLLLIVGQKPSTANGGTVTTPSGWTLLSDNLAQGGYGTALAADTGNTNLFVYSKNIVDGTETGNLSVTIGTNNVSWAVIVVVPADGGAIVYAHSEGADTTGNASMSVTGATALGVTAGDRYIASFCMPTDGVTGWSAFNIAQSGITMGTQAQLAFPDSGTGNDIGGLVFYGSVTSGSSTAAPTMSATAAGTVTNVRGPGTIVRIREIPPVTGDTTEDVNATDASNATATGTQNSFSFDKDFALELPPTPTSANFGAVAAVDSTQSFYVSFAASKTGQLGVVSIRGNLVTGDGSTTLGAAELWSFVAGAPNTLLATTPIKLPVVASGVITYDLNVDFSSVSGAALTSGASYAIVFKGGTDWIAGGQRFETYACQQNGTGAQFFNLFGANGYTWKAGTYGTWGTSYTDVVPVIFAKYATTIGESTDSTVIAGAVVGTITESVTATESSARVIETTQTRTEAGSATDSQAGASIRDADTSESVTANDSSSGSVASAVEAAESVTADHTQNFAFASGGAITETGSATDSAVTARFTPGFLEDSNNIFGSVPPALSNVVSVSDFQSTTVLGPIFVAQASGTVKSVSIFGYRSSFLTSGSIDVQIWQLASNSPTALPQTLLGTATVSYREFNNIGIARSLLNISAANVSITAGTYYALILRNSTLSSVYNWANVTRLDNASAYNYSVSAGVIPRAAFFVGGVWNVSAGNDFLPATIYLSDNTTDIPLGISNTFVSASESLSATDSSDNTINKTFEVDITEFDDATDFTRAYGPFGNTEVVVEELIARDESTRTEAAFAFASDGQGINLFPRFLNSNASTTITLTGTNSYHVQYFEAQSSGLIDEVQVAGRRGNTAASLPTTTGTLEIWTANSSRLPDTLISSIPIDLSRYVTNVTYVPFTFNNVYLNEGTGYCLVFRAGSDWGISLQQFAPGLYTNDTAQRLAARDTNLGLFGSGRYTTNGGSSYTSLNSPFPAIIQYAIANDQQVTGPLLSDSITETVSATESIDVTALDVNKVFEDVTSTDSTTYTTLVARAWAQEANVENFYNSYDQPFTIQSGTGSWIRNTLVSLLAPKPPLYKGSSTVPLTFIKLNFLSFLVGTPPTTPITIKLGTTNGGSQVASWTLNWSDVPTGIYTPVVLNLPANTNLTADVQYYFTAQGGADWNASTTGYWRFQQIFSTSSTLDAYFTSAYAGVASVSGSAKVLFATEPDTFGDSVFGGFEANAEQTDSGAATDEQDSTAFQNNFQDETLTATDSEDSTAAMGVAITETGTVDHAQTNLLTANAWIGDGGVLFNTNYGFVTDTGLSGYGSVTNLRVGNAFIANKSGVVGNVTLFIDRSNTAAPLPATDGTVQLWQLASNSLTANPQTLLASVPLNFASLPTTRSNVNYYFGNVSVTAGVGYAIIIAQSADTSLSTQYVGLRVLSSDFSPQSNYNYARSYSGPLRLSNNGTTWSTLNYIQRFFVGIVAATDTETSTYITQSDIDEFLDDLHDDSGGSLATENYLLDVLDAMAYADGQHVNEVAIDESVSAAEELFSTYVTNSIVNEAATVLDEVSNVVSFAANLSESVSIQDTCANTVDWAVYIAEANNALSSESAQLDAVAFLAETAFVVDYVESSYVTNVATDEAGAVADEQDSVAFQNNLIDEPVDATDFSSNTAEFAPFITESGFALDTLTNVADRIADINEQLVSDTLQESNSVRLAERSETVNATDTKEAIINLFAATLEAASLEDVASAVSDYVGYVDELLAAISEASSQADMYVNRTEAESIFDAVVATYVINGQNLESVNSQDSLAETISYVVYSNNTAAANDDALATQDLGGYITETLSALDVAFAGLIAAIRGDAYFSISALARLQKTPLIDLTYLQQDSASSDVYVYDIAEVVETEYTIAVFDEISYIMSYVYTNDIYAVAEVLMPGASAYVELINAA